SPIRSEVSLAVASCARRSSTTRTRGTGGDVQPGEGAALLARVALERSPRDGAPRDSLRDRSAEDRPDFAAGGESQTRQMGRQGGGFRRNRATHRALLPPLPAARRGEFTDGGV